VEKNKFQNSVAFENWESAVRVIYSIRTILTAALNRKRKKERKRTIQASTEHVVARKHAREREREREFPSHPPILEEQ